MVQLDSGKRLTTCEESVIRFDSVPADENLTWGKAIDRLCKSYRKTSQKDEPRILIVDTDRDASRQLADVLHELDYRIDIARYGHEALGYVRRKAYQLVLMEMNLPDMDGIELFDHMRREPNSTTPQAVILTSAVDSEMTRIAEMRGIQTVLSKPVDLVKLFRCLQQSRDMLIAN